MITSITIALAITWAAERIVPPAPPSEASVRFWLNYVKNGVSLECARRMLGINKCQWAVFASSTLGGHICYDIPPRHRLWLSYSCDRHDTRIFDSAELEPISDPPWTLPVLAR